MNHARDAKDETVRIDVPAREDAEAAGVSAAKPRRLARSSIAPIAVALAMTAGAGALIVAPQAAETVDAVAAPQARTTSVNRDVQRAALPQISASPAVVANWAQAKVSVSPAPTPVKKATTAKKANPAKEATPAAKVVETKTETSKRAAEQAAQQKAAKRAEGRAARAAEERAERRAEKRAAAKKAKARELASTRAAQKTSGTRASSKSGASSKGSTKYKKGGALGLTPFTSTVYADIMSNFSGINSVGGYRANSRSVHQFGRAIDFMITPGSETALGWSIAKYAAANAGRFKIDHIIFSQKIWTPYKPYWRPMENRGSVTENHYDHVHVAVKA